MPVQKLPVVDLDNVNHRRRARETINQVLDHSFNDSRVQTDAEKLAGFTPINAAFEPGELRRAGAEGDGATTYTGQVNKAFSSGEQKITVPVGSFVTGTVTVGSSVRYVSGPGTLKQLAENSNVLEASGIDGLTIEGVRFVGASTSGGSAVSNNVGLKITSCDKLRIRACYFSLLRFHAIHLIDCNDVEIEGNHIEQCALAIRLTGCSKVTINGNTIRDTLLAAGQFTVAIGLDSVDGHAFGVCREVTITDNHIENYVDAQGVLVHAGINVSVHDNTFKNVGISVSFNPFKAGDLIERCSITINKIECPSTGTITNANDGISVQGDPGLDSDGNPIPDPTDIVIQGNIIKDANRVLADDEMAAIRIGYTTNVSVLGNIILTPRCNGIYLTGANVAVSICKNIIDGVVSAAGEQNGIIVPATGNSGLIADNIIRNLNSGSGRGIEIGASNTGLIVKEQVFQTVDANVVGGQNVSACETKTVSGATVDLGNATEIILSNAVATTVTAFTNVIPRKLYSFTSANSNTTIDRTSAFLDGGSNKTLTANDRMLVWGVAGNLIEQAAPVSVNS